MVNNETDAVETTAASVKVHHKITNELTELPCTMMILKQKPRWFKIVQICVA